jgi:type VI secretion system protein ImpC
MADPASDIATQAAPAAVTAELNEFESLLQQQFRPKTPHARQAVETAVRTLAEQALAGTGLVSNDAIGSIEAIIAELDKKLSEQVNLILHHEDFRSLEGTWRGLHHLVSNTETDEKLKIRVFNISKKEVGRVLKKFKGTAWDQSPLFKKIYEDEYGTPGGEPYGALIGDYHFDHSPPDVEILQGMGQIAAAAHAPFISAANASLMNMGTWQELEIHAISPRSFRRRNTLRGVRCGNQKTRNT